MKTRDEIIDNATAQAAIQSTPPITIPRRDAVLTVSFLESYFSQLVAHGMNNGVKGMECEAVLERLRGQL